MAPVVGPWIERSRGVAKALGNALRRRREGAAGRRKKLEDELRGLTAPIVVVLDDIDRLSSPEIRDVFKFVRLTASFPNVVYVLAFDRKRVEHALGEEGVPGRDYLEKILQVGHDLPQVPQDVLDKQLFEALDGAIGRSEEVPDLDSSAWADVFVEVIRPLIRNMRDVRRYAAAVEGTLSETRKQIALVDLLALEAIRVFVPDVFAVLPKAVEGLTTPAGPIAAPWMSARPLQGSRLWSSSQVHFIRCWSERTHHLALRRGFRVRAAVPQHELITWHTPQGSGAGRLLRYLAS